MAMLSRQIFFRDKNASHRVQHTQLYNDEACMKSSRSLVLLLPLPLLSVLPPSSLALNLFDVLS